MSLLSVGAVAVGLAVLLATSVRRRSLTRLGAVAAFAMGISLHLIGGLLFLLPLLAFYLSSSALTKYKKERKEAIEKQLHARAGTRDWVQVFANGGPAVLVALLYLVVPRQWVVVTYFTVFAACNSDTWASEIGVFSSEPPVSILRRIPVQKGLSGGVTTLGTSFAFLGALLLALLYGVTNLHVAGVIGHVIVITLCGLLGSVIDSILGDLVQAKYRSRTRGTLTEKPLEDGVANELVKGYAWVTNDAVNFLSPSLAAVVAALVVGCR